MTRGDALRADEALDEVRDTVARIADAMRLDHAAPQLHLLAPLAAPAHAGGSRRPGAAPARRPSRAFLGELRAFLRHGALRMRWLLVALHQTSAHLLEVFEQWRPWRRRCARERSEGAAALAAYYAHLDFVTDFLEFVRSCYLPARPSRVIAAMLQYEEAARRFAAGAERARAPDPAAGPASAARPRRIPGVELVELEGNYEAVIRRLRRKRPVRIPRGPVVLAARPAGPGGEVRLVQLSSLAGRLLALCDGRRTIDELAAALAASGEDLDGIAPHKVCLFGLEALRRQGFLAGAP